MTSSTRHVPFHRAAIAALIGVSLTFVPGAAGADELDDLYARAADIQEQIDGYQMKLDEASAAYGEALEREEAARAAVDEAVAKQEEIDKELESLQDRLGQRACEQYKTGTAGMVDMFLSADDFDDFLVLLEGIEQINAYDQELIRQQQELDAQWAEAEATARANEAEAAEQRELAEEIQSDAQSQIDELEGVYEGIAADVAVILYAQQAAAAVSYGADYTAAPSGSGSGIDWGGVAAPADANDIVARAYSMLGSDYVWGGVGGSSGGFDCSGLVGYCVTGENARYGTTSTYMGFEQTSNPQPGDIVTSGSHCGIYIGDGQMIHASDYGTGVIIGDVQGDMIAVHPQ